MARFLEVTTSSVNRLAVSAKLPEVKRYLKALENLRHPLLWCYSWNALPARKEGTVMRLIA